MTAISAEGSPPMATKDAKGPADGLAGELGRLLRDALKNGPRNVAAAVNVDDDGEITMVHSENGATRVTRVHRSPSGDTKDQET